MLCKLKNGVWVSGNLKFLGATAFKEGEWAGLVLDEEYREYAKNVGSIQGIGYFDAPGGLGMFVAKEFLQREDNSADIHNAAPTNLTPHGGNLSRIENIDSPKSQVPVSPFRTSATLNSAISPSSSWQPSRPAVRDESQDVSNIVDIDTELNNLARSQDISSVVSMVNMLAKSDHLKKAISSEVKAQVEAALSTSTLEQRLQRMSLTLKSIQKDIRQACQKLSNTRDVASTFDALVHLHLKAEAAVRDLESEKDARSKDCRSLNVEIKRLERELRERSSGWTPSKGRSSRGLRHNEALAKQPYVPHGFGGSSARF